MACFVVPATEAVVTTIATRIIEKRENNKEIVDIENGIDVNELHRERLSSKMKRLNYLLWGGSGLLAFEHLWHGEIQPFFPFLTSASSPEEAMKMLGEMSTVGVSMAIAVTLVWGLMTIVTTRMEDHESKELKKTEIQ